MMSVLKRIWLGESVTRAFLNERLSKEKLTGKVMDVGSGKKTNYLDFIPRSSEATYEVTESKLGEVTDYEKDKLPYNEGSFDTVLFLNVMEHIFNHQHISDEVFRITKTGGKMIGFTPFLMRYHGDPDDFFRYTDQALERILEKSGWSKIIVEPVGKGPFMAAAHQFLRSFPRVFRVIIFIPLYFCDVVFVKLRPHATSHYVLGYLFITEK